MTLLCHAQHCTSPDTHLTSAHVCTKCWKVGHGFSECGPGLRQRIRRDWLMRRSPPTALAAELWCGVLDCSAPETHTTAAHFCGRCLNWGGRCSWPCVRSVVRRPQRVICPICRATCAPVFGQPLFTGKECCVCMAESRLFALTPCGHAQTCEACILEMISVRDAASEEN